MNQREGGERGEREWEMEEKEFGKQCRAKRLEEVNDEKILKKDQQILVHDKGVKNY